MSEHAFDPVYFGERLRVLNPDGDVGFCSFWSPISKAVDKLAEADPEAAAGRGRVAVVGHLYGDGLYAMLCNLLHNPQITHLISAGEDLSGCAVEIEAFLAKGTEPVLMLGRPMRRIIGTKRHLPDLPDFDEAALRARLSYRHFGRLSTPSLVIDLAQHLAAISHAEKIAPRVRVDIPAPSASDFNFQPSDPIAHQITRRRPLEAWRELAVRVMRFGRPSFLRKGRRLELLNTKVVITEPVEETAAQLEAFGFDLARFHTYQRKILDPVLPETISYTYGNRMRGYYPGPDGPLDTITRVIDILSKDPESRHAYISVWDTQRDLTSERGGDSNAPCLVNLWFRKHDDKLTLTASYRAHNLLTAWLENVYGLIAVQRKVADAVCIAPGPLTIISHSLSADPDSSRFVIGQQVLAGWTRDDDTDPTTGKPVLREDPNGYFALSVDEGRGVIIADHLYDGVLVKRYEGTRADLIEAEIASDMAVSLISHAMYLGRELLRQELKLKAAPRAPGAKP
jgi:hypothetical protein